jgi:hypothetical protein
VLILDSGGLSRLAERSARAAALISTFREAGMWPPVVPTVVLAESMSGRPRTDAGVHHLLGSCEVEPTLTAARARRAGELRALARRGSVVDAIVVALAEPYGTVLTPEPGDLGALAAHADGAVEVV